MASLNYSETSNNIKNTKNMIIILDKAFSSLKISNKLNYNKNIIPLKNEIAPLMIKYEQKYFVFLTEDKKLFTTLQKKDKILKKHLYFKELSIYNLNELSKRIKNHIEFNILSNTLNHITNQYQNIFLWILNKESIFVEDIKNNKSFAFRLELIELHDEYKKKINLEKNIAELLDGNLLIKDLKLLIKKETVYKDLIKYEKK